MFLPNIFRILKIDSQTLNRKQIVKYFHLLKYLPVIHDCLDFIDGHMHDAFIIVP